MKNLFFILVLIVLAGPAKGQINPVEKDTTPVSEKFETYSKKRNLKTHSGRDRGIVDTTELYDKIKNYSKKRRFTKTVYGWLFKRSTEAVPFTEDKPQIDYDAYKGKIVRKIIIDTKDPFGYSITDSTRTPRKWVERVGNAVHIKSKDFAIRNFLLIKEKEPFDAGKTLESARLIRTQDFIRDAIIIPQMVPHAKDSVDLVITSLDSWSLIPEVSVSSTKAGGKIKERNFIGMGHRAEFGYLKRFEDSENAFDVAYHVPNIRHTFIGASANYVIDFENRFQKAISIDRIFYSPYTRWAGGIFFEERALARPLMNDSLEMELIDIRFGASDFWGAHAFPISALSEEHKITNLVLSSRVFKISYPKKPPAEFDRINYFSRETFFLGSVGLSTRQYIQDYYIFKDGYTEDVPVGSIYSLTLGTQYKNDRTRLYSGLRLSRGDYFNFGFLSGNIEFGTFWNHKKIQQAAVSFQTNYFSNLMSWGKWKFRQFVKPQIIIGINRLDSPADRLSLNENPYYTGSEGKMYELQDIGTIRGFESHVFGNNKYVLDLQTQFYSPWALWGFRINPYANLSLGMITNDSHSPGSNKLYSSFGLGVLVRNDYLVFESFQFSFAFYPNIPGQGENVFKTNVFDSDDFGFQEYLISKPRPVFYR